MNKSNNKIQQIAVSELFDGRLFFIPSYQRGYRWTKTQIYDLCNDLLEYSIRPNKDPKSFCCLQPLILRKVTKKIQGKDTVVYEVIDGQQRLTSLFILVRNLMKTVGCNNLEDFKDLYDLTFYKIYYETRPDDYEALEKLGIEPFNYCDVMDIDLAHVINAFNFVKMWLDNDKDDDPDCARSTWSLFSKERFSKKNIANKLLKLLTNSQETEEPEGNAQFVWYEIVPDKDAIQEFLSENKGKIKLTDTEKIRGLFMQRKNKELINSLIQTGIAKDWELIENTLHNNAFWSFISNDTHQEDGRINIIFQYIYDRDCTNKSYQGDDFLFRYYYQLLNSKSDFNAVIIEEWEKVKAAFRMLQNWYSNPRVYNWVGLLTKEQCVKTVDIANLYDKETVVTTEDFIEELKKKVCETIVNEIPIDEDGNVVLDVKGEYIKLFFDKPADKKKIPGVLRFLNVNVLCTHIDKLLEDVDKPDEEKKNSDIGRSNRDELCGIYRFPFDALDSFGWDIEHIDSATTNELKQPKEQEVWIEEAESALGTELTENKGYKEQKDALKTANESTRPLIIANILRIIRERIGEDDSEDRKNWIGNLTLLDSGTNRMYKNKIFARKRSIIHDRVNRGVYVPVCTQNIFNKTFDHCTKDNLRWDINDKKCYHEFILKQVKTFKDKYKIK